MEAFLKESLRTIVTKHPNDLSEITLVFNNRRPALFVKHYLREILDGTYFLPRTIVFDDLVSELGDTELVPNEFLVFELYDIHRRVNPADQRTLEQFMPMADMMLADFSEIDRYMVNVADLYGNLHDLKEIGEWQIEGRELTQFQKDYLRFYKSIYSYYTELRSLLESRGQAYYGMAYRRVAENIDSILDSYNDGMFYFLGFNALSKCEERIIKAYTRLGRAKYIPDGDKYYFDDTSQEAGFFLRKHRELSSVEEYREHFAKSKRTINIVKAPDNVSQAKYAGNLLREIVSDDGGIPVAETALVLGDEWLITPILNSLPDGIGQANITMGIPFTQTDMHSLALTVLSLYADSRIDRQGRLLFYHKDLTDLLGNRYIDSLIGNEKVSSLTKRYLTDRNVIYARLSEIETMFAELQISMQSIRFLFEANPSKPFDILGVVKRLAECLITEKHIADGSKEKAASESLVQVIDYIKTLKTSVEATNNRVIPIDDTTTLKKIYLRIAQRHSISFIGKPMSGLQILGVLETRCLDFRRVILLSANEGVIPSSRSNNTLIPNSLKRHFGMPTYYERDAVYAYNFYHLLQRAEEVYIVSSNDGNKDSESRFVLQVRAELAKRYADTVAINELTVTTSNRCCDKALRNSVEKNDDIMQRLLTKCYSPSSLNAYISCPMRFYYEKVLHIRQDDEINDTLESSDLGTVIHKCLEDIYKPFEHGLVDKERLAAEIDTVPLRIETLLEQCFTNGRIHEGKTDLMRSVAIAQVQHFLKQEVAMLEQGHKVEIVQLEELMETPVKFPLDSNGDPVEVQFNTKADRIDRIDGQLRVVDYKSGRVKKEDVAVKTLDPDKWRTLPEKWFQVMFYAWYYSRLHKITEPIVSGLCPLQHLGGDFMSASVGDSQKLDSEILATFEQTLNNILTEILDKNTPFAPRPDKHCDYCTIAQVCPKTAEAILKNQQDNNSHKE